MRDQPLLIALVAVQFLIHALGWAMAARLSRPVRAVEAHFAVFWLLLAAGLLLYVPAWPSGYVARNAADVLIVASMAVQHRGMALYWGYPTRRQGYAYLALIGLTLLSLTVSLALTNGHGLRVATVCVGVALALLATVRLIRRHAASDTPVFAAVLAGGYGLLALALLGRAVQALSVGAQTKISIDAPGHSNVPLVILVMLIGGLINLGQIRLVLGLVLQYLTDQAQTDPLTGAVNRRGLSQRIEQLHQRARQSNPGYAVLMVDVDHFKAINDTHGHAEGDRVLVRVAQCLRDGLRGGDVVARWGGEEFCVLLPRMRQADAKALAERMVLQVAASGTPRVTVSIGVAEAQLQDESPDDVIRRADAALYRAKDSGRNQVITAGALVPG